jgi:hypothetical protein
MLSRPAEAVPKKTAKSAQLVVSYNSATLTAVFNTPTHPPPPQIAEAISQSNLNPYGFNTPRHLMFVS